MHCNFLEGNGPGRSKKPKKSKTIIHIKAGWVWQGPAFFSVGGGTGLPSPFVHITSGMGPFSWSPPLSQIALAA